MMRRYFLVTLAVAGLVLAGCGDDSSSEDESSSSDTTAAPVDDGYGPSDTTETTAAPADTGAATVAVAEIDGVGDVLVGPDGLTLYLFDQDDGLTTACTGGCADAWPPLVAEGDAVAGEGVDAALIETAEGGQAAYNGHLLYTFSGDGAPGEANGIGIPSWFPVGAAGNAVS